MKFIDQTNISNLKLKKRCLGLTLGLALALIVLNIDKKLWWPLELETINARNTSSFSKGTKTFTKDIIVILFDDKTQFLLRQNSIPIKDFEKKGKDLINLAIEKLESNNIKAIGLNLNLGITSSSDSDKLSKTISKYKNIVIADSIYSSRNQNTALSVSRTGYGELIADYDKIVHERKLLAKGYKDTPSFSYVLYTISTKNAIDKALKKANAYYIRYSKVPIKKYSFIDLIQGKINRVDLKNKVAILGIGLKSKLISDGLTTPFIKNLYISDSEVKATDFANLLGKSYLLKLSSDDYPLIFIAISIILGIIFCSINPINSLILAGTLFLGHLTFCQIAYSYLNTIVEFVPALFLILGNLIMGILVFLQINLQEQNKELEVSRTELETKNIELTSTLSELNKRLEELKEVKKMLSTRSEEERKRISRELHDDTLARITDLKRYIEAMISSGTLPINDKKQLGVSIQILDNVTYEIRRIINALRPSMLDNTLGLIPAIENLLDELTKRSSHKIQTQLKTSFLRLRLEESHEINLYRIIQEALNNVFKHSGATKVEITIEKQPGQVLFLISDNGIGLEKNLTNYNLGKSFGLIDIRERAELIGANIQYINKPNGTGTSLEITIPLDTAIEIKKNDFTVSPVPAGVII